MTLETHGRWPWVAAGLVAPAWSSVAARRDELPEDGLWVAGLALPILVSHQSEEWVWPGGFLPFCNQRLLGSDRPDWPLTERDGFHVNVTVGRSARSPAWCCGGGRPWSSRPFFGLKPAMPSCTPPWLFESVATTRES